MRTRPSRLKTARLARDIAALDHRAWERTAAIAAAAVGLSLAWPLLQGSPVLRGVLLAAVLAVQGVCLRRLLRDLRELRRLRLEGAGTPD